MKNLRSIAAIFILFLLVQTFWIPIRAEGESHDTFTTGKVVKHSDERLILREDSTDKIIDFAISPKVKLRQLKSLRDLRKGDSVEILFKHQNGNPTITMIYLDRE